MELLWKTMLGGAWGFLCWAAGVEVTAGVAAAAVYLIPPVMIGVW